MLNIPAQHYNNDNSLQVLPENVPGLKHIDNGIWVGSEGGNPPIIAINNVPHHRFLDRLYIPCKTTELSNRQIVTINRFREKTIGTDPQYMYRTKVRTLFSKSLQTLPQMRIVEIGPGRFPMQLSNFVNYTAVEIDQSAVQHLKSTGIDVIDPGQFSHEFDLCLALFVFHFDVPSRTLQRICESMKLGGLFIFNVVTSAADIRTLAFSRLSELGFSGTCVDLMPDYKKNDAIFVCSNTNSNPLAELLYNKIISEIERGRSP